MITPAGPLLPDGLAVLADHAETEGIRIVSKIIDRWQDGSERYRSMGETILAAVDDEQIVGIGGLTTCPEVAGALRMRRFYVGPPWRRRGIAQVLATELISIGFEHADLLTCNAGASAAAPIFWERMGFGPADDAGITHVLRFLPPGP